jgi:hypothetical protein
MVLLDTDSNFSSPCHDKVLDKTLRIIASARVKAKTPYSTSPKADETKIILIKVAIA